MLKKYLYIFFISMVPLIELRGAIPVSQILSLPLIPSYMVCILGNMLPVPIIYLFARKVLEWGADKPVIGKFFTFCLEKGEKWKRIIFGTVVICRDSASGNRCMDRHISSKYFRHGF